MWADFNEGKMWLSKDIDPSFLLVYTLTLKDHQPNTMLLRNKSKSGHFRTFIENYKAGNVYFENIDIKNITYDVIQMTIS